MKTEKGSKGLRLETTKWSGQRGEESAKNNEKEPMTMKGNY